MSAAEKTSSPVETEASLVERARIGDESAYSALYRRHASYIAGVACRLLGQDGDVDDIVQETFYLGFRSLHSIHEVSKLRAFLVTIAVRRVQARFAFRSRLRQVLSDWKSLAPEHSDPRELHRVDDLRKMLARLRPKHRHAWVLVRVEGFARPDAAEMMNVSLASVKRWVALVDERVEHLHAP